MSDWLVTCHRLEQYPSLVLVVTADTHEALSAVTSVAQAMQGLQIKLGAILAVAGVAVLALVILLSCNLIKRVTAPITKMAELSAQLISNVGSPNMFSNVPDLDVQSVDEVSDLASQFITTVHELRGIIQQQQAAQEAARTVQRTDSGVRSAALWNVAIPEGELYPQNPPSSTAISGNRSSVYAASAPPA
jgi:methyl-accepting chemotaxis protein